METTKIPTCPYCLKQHEFVVDCKVTDLKNEQTILLGKLLRTSGWEQRIQELEKKNFELLRKTEELEKQVAEKDAQLQAAVEHLKKLCAPEPDGFGGFVSDEFIPKEEIEARQFLKEMEGKK